MTHYTSSGLPHGYAVYPGPISFELTPKDRSISLDFSLASSERVGLEGLVSIRKLILFEVDESHKMTASRVKEHSTVLGGSLRLLETGTHYGLEGGEFLDLVMEGGTLTQLSLENGELHIVLVGTFERIWLKGASEEVQDLVPSWLDVWISHLTN